MPGCLLFHFLCWQPPIERFFFLSMACNLFSTFFFHHKKIFIFSVLIQRVQVVLIAETFATKSFSFFTTSLLVLPSYFFSKFRAFIIIWSIHCTSIIHRFISNLYLMKSEKSHNELNAPQTKRRTWNQTNMNLLIEQWAYTVELMLRQPPQEGKKTRRKSQKQTIIKKCEEKTKKREVHTLTFFQISVKEIQRLYKKIYEVFFDWLSRLNSLRFFNWCFYLRNPLLSDWRLISRIDENYNS